MDQVDSLLKRPKAYYNIDGAGELGMGFLCLGYALLLWLQLHTSKDSIWNQQYVLFIWVGLMVTMIYFGTKAIKNHITYPRTGFVAYRKQNRIWTAIVAFVVSALFAAGLALAAHSHRHVVMPVFFIGLIFAAGYAFGIARTVRWKWMVVFAQVIGSLAMAVLPGGLAATLVGGAPTPGLLPASLTKFVGALLLCFMRYQFLDLSSPYASSNGGSQ